MDGSESPPAWQCDRELARRAAAGDRAALHAVVDRHTRDLLRLARGLCPTAADAEDVVQETLVAAFRKIGTFDGRASLRTWLSRILVRRAGRLWRRHRARPTRPLEAAGVGGVGGVGPPAAEASAGVDCRLDLTAALPRLAREFREVIVLRELQGMSYEQIATTLGVPRGTVDSRLHRARRELRQLLRAYELNPERRP